ncbi:MAG: hypothetical protein NVSMB39_4130 [Candidatus Saccharimonadales bacterium]
MTFDRITIIYNPNSTGNAPAMARELHEQIGERLPGVLADLVQTERAGHAEELALDAAQASERPLIVSVSGDGGYHEVVNGVMASGNLKAAAAVHAAGNANDHRSAIRERPLIESIVLGETVKFDLLKVVTPQATRYTHSYLGLGLSPVVAVELNRHKLNAIKELKLVFQTFWGYEPFRIKVPNGRIRTYDSLVCANIPRMAKVLKLSDQNLPNDGLFELILVPGGSKLRLVITALRLITIGPAKAHKLSSYNFETLKPMPMQLDGEVVDLGAHAKVTVTAAKQVLNTLV